MCGLTLVDFVVGSLVAGSWTVNSLTAGFLVVDFLCVAVFFAVSNLIFGGGEKNERSIVYEVTLCYRLCTGGETNLNERHLKNSWSWVISPYALKNLSYYT